MKPVRTEEKMAACTASEIGAVGEYFMQTYKYQEKV
jgi:hypothetical protein